MRNMPNIPAPPSMPNRPNTTAMALSMRKRMVNNRMSEKSDMVVFLSCLDLAKT